MQRLVVNIWSNGQAEEAGEFYAASLPRTTTEIESRYPEADLLPFQEPLAGKPLTVTVWVDGAKLTIINAGPEFTPNPSLSLILNFDTRRNRQAREELDDTWAALCEGGKVLMPLEQYPFSDRYGWVQDRYGVSWQLMLSAEPDIPSNFLIPNLMFAGKAQNRAAEAVEFYTSLFHGEIQSMVPYGQGNEVVRPDSVMFSQFTLGGECLSAMDSGFAQDLDFSLGMSLEWDCDGQAEIDRIWDALSAVPEYEQCGWLVDKFGVAWQIVPSNMGELMERPGAFGKMMNMKKLIIDDF